MYRFGAGREQQHLKEVSPRCEVAGPLFPAADSTFSSCTTLSCWIELFETLRGGKRVKSRRKSERTGKGVSGCLEHNPGPAISPSAVQGPERARGLCHFPVCFGAECISVLVISVLVELLVC